MGTSKFNAGGNLGAALTMYCEKIQYLSSSEVVQQRREIFKTLNGDAFFPLKRWPGETTVLEEANWGQSNLQAVALLHWKWLLSRLDLPLDPVVTNLGNS